MACDCRPWPCRRQARFENGIDRFTLRFVDPTKEEGFAHTHKAQLCRYTALAAIALASISLLAGLTAHRFWDDSQYPTTEARELGRWQLLISVVITVPVLLALISGRLLAKYNFIGTLGLEIIVVSACTCYLVLMVTIAKYYSARLFGHDDPEAIWGVDLGSTDGSVALYIDIIVTALHLLLPIRWVVLAPMEVVAVLAYIVPAMLLGSPATNMVPIIVIGLLSLTVFAAIGKRAFERQERELFAGFLAEKQMRFQAEFQLSRVASGEVAKAEDIGSERSALSRPGTTMSAAAFNGSLERASLDQIHAIGRREQWLICSSEVELFSDRVDEELFSLGEGGFGIVVLGSYHNTLVAVKAPKRNIVEHGAMSSCLPQLCNELRILRRIRHPNIAFLYGACLDVALGKLCLVLEFVDGVPLGAFIRGLSQGPDRLAEPPPGVSEARDPTSSSSARSLVVFDILNVLRYLHSMDPIVVHGDLKDSNVFVEERHRRSGRRSYRAKLLDFGLSRLVTRNARPLGGTLRWMAPELLCRQAVPPDMAADCYSFGLLTYFIVTGCMPFEGKRKERVLNRLRRGQPPSLVWPAPADELTQACRPVVEQCTQPEPSLRPSTQHVSRELATTALNQFVARAMETVVEALGTGRSGGGINARPTAADTSASPDLTAFNGLLEARQPNGASVGSLMPGRSSGNLSPVQEHEVLLSQGAQDGAAAAPPSIPGSAPEQLAHPEFRPTPLSTQCLALAYLLLQWNVPMPAGNRCCWLHAALDCLDRVRTELRRTPCSVQDDGMFCGQCDRCGLLVMQGGSSCDFCEAPGASSVGADTRHSGDTLSV